VNTEVRNIGVIVGSMRRASFNRRLAHALIATAPPSLRLEIIEIGAMPMYNLDEEAAPPAAWTTFRDAVKAADGLLFLTPEYNRSVPSVLKNAIDVGSRPKGSNAYDAKPAAVISLSPGALGAFGANQHLRQSLMCLNVFTMPAPEAYIGGADKLFDEADRIVVESTRKFLDQFMQTFAKWVERTGHFSAA
jgi:chromate reductase